MSLAPRQTKAFDAARDVSPAKGVTDDARLAPLGLTARECEVMHWISAGKRDREIATILGLSSRTVEKHVCHILEKLRVETRTAAASECRYSFILSAINGDPSGQPTTPDASRRRITGKRGGSPDPQTTRR